MSTDITLLPCELPDVLTANARVCVSLSGGLDSVSLLHRLVQLRQQAHENLELHALYLRYLTPDFFAPEGAAEEKLCRTVCAQWQVQLHRVELRIDHKQGLGLEGAAREQRLQIWQTLLPRLGINALALAHHADDASETVLLQLLRGSGLLGVSGMKSLQTLWMPTEHRPNCPIYLWRPLVSVPRNDIERYATQHNLAFITDRANRDPRLKRTIVRHQLMPLMRHHWPQLEQSLSRFTAQAREAQSLLQHFTVRDAQLAYAGDLPPTIHPLDKLPKHSTDETWHPHYLPVPLNWDLARRKNLIRGWLSYLEKKLPTSEQLSDWLRQVDQTDALPHWTFQGDHYYWWRSALWRQTALVSPEKNCFDLTDNWQGSAIPWPNESRLIYFSPRVEWLQWIASGAALKIATQSELQSPLLREHPAQPQRDLKYLYQRAAIPPWHRATYPLLMTTAGQLLAIPGIARSHLIPPACQLEWRTT